MRPLKSLDARKFRRIAVLVVVIAGAHEQEIAGEAHHLGAPSPALALGLHGPARVRRRPRRALDPMMVADLLVDAVFGGGLAHVIQDRGPSAIALGSVHGLNE